MCSDIDIQVKEFRIPAGGLAINNTIYINEDTSLAYTIEVFYFIILHEIAHHKRNIKANTEEKLIEFGKGDFELFLDFVISEEIIADRYASVIFNYLNREKIDYGGQNLHLESRRNEYKQKSQMMYNQLPDSVDEYSEYLLKVLV